MKYLCIIPARGGSKGIKNKNIIDLAGKPLIAWTIEQATACTKIDRVIVSTDSKEIAAISEQYGAEVPFLRPTNIANDTASTESAVLHAIDTLHKEEQYQADAVILLQCTSPLRLSGRIKEAIETFESSAADSLLSVGPFHHFLWHQEGNEVKANYDFTQRPRRQDIKNEDRRYLENGSIYITSTKVWHSMGNRLGGHIELFQMNAEESFEIDTELDLFLLDVLMRRLLL